MVVSNENVGSPTTIWSLQWKCVVSNKNLWSPMKIWWSPTKHGGLQQKYGVSNENIGVSNDNLGVSNERGSPIVLQWWWFLPRLQLLHKCRVYLKDELKNSLIILILFFLLTFRFDCVRNCSIDLISGS